MGRLQLIELNYEDKRFPFGAKIEKSMRLLFFVTMIVLVLPWPVFGEANFEKWVESFKAEAIGNGISSSLLDKAFQGVAPISRVLELDRK